jgi:hypothetical protein
LESRPPRASIRIDAARHQAPFPSHPGRTRALALPFFTDSHADRGRREARIGNLYAILIGKLPCFPRETEAMRPTPSTATQSEYRLPATARADSGESGPFREQLHPVFVIVWLASLVRVAGAVHLHEIFGAEATLALMTLVGVTIYAFSTRSRDRRRADQENVSTAGNGGPGFAKR